MSHIIYSDEDSEIEPEPIEVTEPVTEPVTKPVKKRVTKSVKKVVEPMVDVVENVVKKVRKTLSEEQKQVLRDRLAKARDSKKIKNTPVEEAVEEAVEVVEKIPLTKQTKVIKKQPEPKVEAEPEPVKVKRKYIKKVKIPFNPF
jgi:hypothetical protein